MKNYDKIIEDGLKLEPDFKLGIDFKDQVAKLIRNRERLTQRKFYMLISLGTLVILGAGIGLMLFFGQLEVYGK